MDDRFKAEEAANYDEAIRRRIPLYREIQTLMTSLLPFPKKEYLRVLDLGCGTGETSISLLKEYPLARITGIDSSHDMLEAARKKVKHTTWRVDFLCQDIREVRSWESGVGSPLFCEGGFDVIVSAFSLHFLNEDEKEEILRKCLALLKDGGMFIDSEAVLSPSEKVYNMYMDKWKDFMRSNGFSDEEIGSHILKFLRDVKPMTVDNQLGLMRKTGFRDVECYFKYLNWAVFGGCKS
ncbi:MAG: class I SAM-dependent methyltransferase [Deltaproteobacteria bacterium]|nr:class I SAM-dependent methyltransferase [Deltaproteobacteria bacterium]